MLMTSNDIELLLEYGGRLQGEENVAIGYQFENRELALITIYASQNNHSNDVSTTLYVDNEIVENLTYSYDKFKYMILTLIKQERLRRDYVLRHNK